MRFYVYVDGFNLYYRCLRSTPYKWLNIHSLCEKLIGSHGKIEKIKYFTAKVSDTVDDPEQSLRQQKYIDALEALTPHLEIYYGMFKKRTPTGRLISPPINGVSIVKIEKFEEKGSDVNLAVHMLNDAWKNEYDAAALISNDSDLSESMNLIKQEFSHKKIYLLSPSKDQITYALKQYADQIRKIRPGLLAASQMPETLPGTTIKKPDSW